MPVGKLIGNEAAHRVSDGAREALVTTTTETTATTTVTKAEATTTGAGTGFASLDAKEVAADGAWIAAQKAGGAAKGTSTKSPIATRFPELASRLSFNDNLSILLDRADARALHGGGDANLSAADVHALYDVTKRLGVSPGELEDAERIARVFTEQGNPNAGILCELAAMLREDFAAQGFAMKAVAVASDVGRKDLLPSLTPDVKEPTRRQRAVQFLDDTVGAVKVPELKLPKG